MKRWIKYTSFLFIHMVKIELEVRNLDELREALAAGAPDMYIQGGLSNTASQPLNTNLHMRSLYV